MSGVRYYFRLTVSSVSVLAAGSIPHGPLNGDLMALCSEAEPSLTPLAPGDGHRGGRERHPGPEHEEGQEGGGAVAPPFLLPLHLLPLLPAPQGLRRPGQRPGGVGGASGLHQAQRRQGG